MRVRTRRKSPRNHAPTHPPTQSPAHARTHAPTHTPTHTSAHPPTHALTHGTARTRPYSPLPSQVRPRRSASSSRSERRSSPAERARSHAPRCPRAAATDSQPVRLQAVDSGGHRGETLGRHGEVSGCRGNAAPGPPRCVRTGHRARPATAKRNRGVGAPSTASAAGSDGSDDVLPRSRRCRWGFKAPASLAALPVHQRFWPNMNFVHVLRDGRDIALSDNQNQVDRCPHRRLARPPAWSAGCDASFFARLARAARAPSSACRAARS